MGNHSVNLGASSQDLGLKKSDFPLFSHHPSLHYLDSAATSQKPRCVIDAIAACYEQTCAPINRGLYELATDATQRYEQARSSIARFINAPSPRQCVYTRSATESINLVAEGWASKQLTAGDEVWVSAMEHHANYLPWQRVCEDVGAILRVIPVSVSGQLLLEDEKSLFGPRTQLIALTHVSNVLGTINPVSDIISKAKHNGIPVLLDACQSVGHMPVDVQALDCDFMVFSGHKMYGPDGVGVLYAQPACLEKIEPLLLGGGMVDKVLLDSHESKSMQSNLWSPLPQRLEAGSPNLTGAVGLAAAIDYLEQLDLGKLHEHVSTLATHASAQLGDIDGVRVLGQKGGADKKDELRSGIVSFTIEGIHPHDIAQVAADNHVAIRAGHHCAQPLMNALNVDSTARASFALYNTMEDVQALVAAVKSVVSLFGRRS